jgi:hypothetical protein
MTTEFTANDKEIAQEVLTEILYLTLTVSPHLREYFVALAEGFTKILGIEELERSMEYANYRARVAAGQ